MGPPRLCFIRHDKGPEVEIAIQPVIEPLPLELQRVTRIAADTPELTRLAEEIIHAGAGEVVAILDRRDTRRPEEWAAAAHAFRVAPETLLCATTPPDSVSHRKGYLEAMILLAHGGQGEDSRLTFRHSRGNSTAADLRPLLTRYELLEAVGSLPRKGTFASELTLSIPASFLNIWFETPRQRTRRFFYAYSRVAMALQELFRRWMRFEWLSDLRRFEDHVGGRALVVYWLSPPRAAASYSEFMYDLMSEQTLDRLCRGVRRLGVEFAALASRLEAAGVEQQITHWYRGNHKKVVAPVRREERSLKRLLAMDSDVLDRLIGFGVHARAHREGTADPDTPARHLIDIVSDFAHDLRSDIRKGPLPDWSHDLATLVMIEATNALRAEIGLPHGIACSLTVTTEDGRQLNYESEALLRRAEEENRTDDDSSSENLEEADALPSQE